ncbi:TonB-dependent receptor [Chitinophaga ginsengisegetis]|uniref:TonB-dependent receptor n=1 Tax=Chitinophaga ginsengisegetis TaxID=393003 RepID=UPI000DB9C517|nr:TonB-dependent receptor [Chitinophaga ginsengisegetis]MDR6568162.1 TonB-linked SusC/RagA family outer membrane protein [Chitinophaga ginsengisegetis]MDR6647283.1 TonB-linked SusC/RagA family outer membrane protein [Chitinophaga ginsengisegetis]MDR6653632.1 TonB-linked SusC/RagA family outer membrane protein [Chitinophaga ginsengisegetis]
MKFLATGILPAVKRWPAKPLWIFMTILLLHLNAYAQHVTISVKNVPMEKVLVLLKQQTGYSFIWHDQPPSALNKVSLECKDQPLEQVLKSFLGNLSLQYEITDKIVVITKKTTPLPAGKELDRITISGKISDEKGSPLPGVSIRVKGTSLGITTDSQGSFSLAVPDNNSILVCSYVGFESKEVSVNGQSSINIVLKLQSASLNDLVVIGYGTQQKKNLTSSVSSIKGSELAGVAVTSLDAALQGKAAGMQVVQNSGAPGDETYIRIRGNGSLFGENRPLYVIDGVPMSNLPAAQYGVSGDGQRIATTNNINPNDIQSVEILKDAAATAIYGSRGANGVILITTKRGAEGKSRFNFNMYTGVADIPKRLPLLNGEQFVELFKESRVNAGLPVDSAVVNTGRNTDWQDAIFRSAPVSNYNLSISGGTGKTSHYVSLGYLDQTGTIVGLQHYKRFNGRVNFDFAASDKLKIGVNLTGVRSTNNRMDNSFSGQSVLALALIENPNDPVYNPNGTYYTDRNRRWTNPVMIANNLRFQSIVNSYIGNVYGEYTILPGLKFKTSFGFDNQQVTDDRYQSKLVNNGSAASGFVSVFTQFLWVNENTLSYAPVLKGKHKLTALLGQSAQEANVRRISVSGNTNSTDIIQAVTGFTSLSAPLDYRSQWGLVSYFGRLSYNYDDRYLLEGVLRTDGSSRFGENKKYGFFPSVAAGWRVTNEAFMKQQRFINELKLRASIGVTGNNEGLGSDFPALATYSTGYNYGSEAGIAATSLSNVDLSWEATTATNLGLDLSFWDSRISVTVDAYRKLTNRLIFKLDLPYTSGFNRTNGANIGQMVNKGLEIGINTDNIRGKFTWSTNFNLYFNRNKITSLPETVAGDPSSSDFTESLPGSFGTSLPTSIFRVGQPVGSFFGYRSKGVDVKTGNMIYDDINADGRITAADRVILGNALPDYTGGITNTFGYRGVDLSFFLYWSYGNKVYNQTRNMLERMSGYNNGDVRTLNRWTPENTITDVPRAVFNDPATPNSLTNGEVSQRFVEDGSFIRMKNVTLGYTFRQELLKKVRISSARIYASAQNLFLITSYSGLDPESQNQSVKNSQLGIDWAVQPQPRTFLLGLNVNF